MDLGSDTRIRAVFDAVALESERLPSRLDVALNVRSLHVCGVRAHGELFHQQRPSAADQYRRQHQQGGGHRWDPHVAQEDRGEEGNGAQHRDGEQHEPAGSTAWMSV